MSAGEPVVKPKTVTKKTKDDKENSSDRDKQDSPGLDTSQDEEFARRLQQELLDEQQEMDAQLARRLHEEEQQKQMPTPAVRMAGPGGRPMSATPLQNLFQTLFGLTARTMELDEEDEDEDTTPAMEPGADSNTRPARPLGVMRPIGNRNISPRRGAGRSPERQRRGTNRSDDGGPAGRGAGAGATAGTRPDDPADLLPGVRLNPARVGAGSRPEARRGSQPDDPSDLLPGVRLNPVRIGAGAGPGGPGLRPRRARRVIVGANAPQEEGSQGHEGAGMPPANVRPISAIRRPGLGPREETMNLPDGELDPDFMVLDVSPTERNREDHFVNIMRDPFFLMLLLMGRHPGMMIPDDVDIGDYEALWDLAERLGEVRDRGMKDEDINKLPTRTYRRKAGGKSENCSICLSEFKNGEKVQLLPCKHEFHQSCLPEWLKRNATCPVCRQDVMKSKSD